MEFSPYSNDLPKRLPDTFLISYHLILFLTQSGRVILMEKSDLEAERVALFESVMNNQRRMKQLEANLLERLTSTQVSSQDPKKHSNC
jgi:ATP-binding dynein motor region